MKRFESYPDMTGRSYKRHPFAERKKVVEFYESGLSSKRIASKLGIDDSMVRSWIRKYRKYGLDSLQPYWRKKNESILRTPSLRIQDEQLFKEACTAYGNSLEPLASITRRHGLNYASFRYYLFRYQPELVARRASLKEGRTSK